MNENKKFLKEKLSEKDLSKVPGGAVIRVNPEDLREMNINLKPYLVVDEASNRIVGSYDSPEEAKLRDYSKPLTTINKSELQNRIYVNNKGEYIYHK